MLFQLKFNENANFKWERISSSLDVYGSDLQILYQVTKQLNAVFWKSKHSWTKMLFIWSWKKHICEMRFPASPNLSFIATDPPTGEYLHGLSVEG